MKLSDRIALITGGGRGIGRAVAFAFAREGARVAVVARTETEVERVAAEIRAECKVEATYTVCDVSDASDVARAYNQVTEVFRREPDIVVNNAGIAESAPLVKTDDEMWRRIIETNLSGTFYFMRAALPAMIAAGWGRVINVASIAGKSGAPYVAAYTASKHGVLGLTRSAAMEVATKGVTVNAVCPGYVDTEMVGNALRIIGQKTGKTANEALEIIKRQSPQNRLVTSEEVAAVALLLASEEGRGINGQGINLDGGSVFY